MGGVGGNNPQITTASKVLTPNQPVLLPALAGGGSLNIVFATQTGFTYQLQSTTSLSPASWTDEGSPVAGTGGSMTNTISLSGVIDPKFYRMAVQ